MHTTPRTEHHTCRDHEEAGTASETDKRPLKASHPPGHAPHDKHIYRILEIRISVQSQVSHAALCTQKRTVPESANSHSISHIPSAISHAPSATRHQPATRHAPSATRRNFKAQSCSPRGRAEAGRQAGSAGVEHSEPNPGLSAHSQRYRSVHAPGSLPGQRPWKTGGGVASGASCERPATDGAAAVSAAGSSAGCRVQDRVREETGPSPRHELTAADCDAICKQKIRGKSVRTQGSLPPADPWRIRARSEPDPPTTCTTNSLW